jgi:hypothetical protein
MRNKCVIIFVLSAFVALIPISIFPADASNTPEEGIKALFLQWNESLKTGNPGKVADNYADDAI